VTDLATDLVTRASAVVGSRFGRRGFFARSAVVGSAVVTNPLTYALQPTTAYAAVCSCNGSSCTCGSLCCDGYTEFCCTLSGENKCPPNTLLGGWWKVDGSSFCGGPRYYMDCNAPCNGCGCGGNGICSGACSGTPCGCAQGSCNNRKAGCTQFRYGQCNQNVACIGPILCRVVTCLPPWSIDASCTTTNRYDSNTAGHDRPCLHSVVGNLDTAELVPGNGVRLRGWALDFDTSTPVLISTYVDGVLTADIAANTPRPDIANLYPGYGQQHGFDVTVSLQAGGNRQVCVYARNKGPGSTDKLLGCNTFTPPDPIGGFDSADGGNSNVRVTGWAIDGNTTAPIDVHIYIDDQPRLSVLANKPRPDVAAAYPAWGGNHGFDVTIPNVAAGARGVCVFAIDVGQGTNQLIRCRTANVIGLAGFNDVSFDNPFGADIVWLVDNDIATGFPDGSFRPTGSVSRQAMASFLFNLSTLVGGPGPGTPGAFSDVPPSHPFHQQISWLDGNDIANGFLDGTFRPTETVTRQAMAAFLFRFSALVGGPGPGSPTSFSDVPLTHPFFDEISWLASNDIAGGYSDGTFRPGAPVSRQATAAFLHRLFELLP